MFGQSQGLFIPLFLEGAAVSPANLFTGKLVHFIRQNRISVVVCVPAYSRPPLKPFATHNFSAAQRVWVEVLGLCRGSGASPRAGGILEKAEVCRDQDMG